LELRKTIKKLKRFDFLEHSADVYIAAYGNDLAEAFENAAFAMFETMIDTKNVDLKNEITIKIKGFDIKSLLYSWLEELLIKFEVEDLLFSEFKVTEIKKVRDGFKLKGKIYGEPFDSERHQQRVGIKGITYHLMEIQEKKGDTIVKFILDI
jgi:SHS2 domain-containing protein